MLLDALPSGNQRLMRARLRAAGPPATEVFIWAEDVQAGKPDPQGYFLAARALNASSFAVIEDAQAGIAAGRAASAFVIAVAASHEKSQLSAADIVLDDLGGLSASSTPEGLIVVFNFMARAGSKQSQHIESLLRVLNTS